MLLVTSLLLLLGSPCTQLTLEADSYTLGGHRFDAPEHIRGLHVRGDSSGAPVRIPGNPAKSFYLWALDTELDGVERYDRLAVSATTDVGDSPEVLAPIDIRTRNRVETNDGVVWLVVRAFDHDLRRLEICVEPYR